MCGSEELVSFLDLGAQPPADRFLKSKNETEQRFPLIVKSCQSCGLVQLGHVVSPEILYCQDYPYDASTAATAQNHWKEFADSIECKKGSLVVDIGSNVGVLLQAFKDNGAKVLGVDPAANITKIANTNGIETITGFFNEAIAESIVRQKGQAAIITGTNVFAHIDDLDALMKAVDILLEPEGSFIFEVPYLVNLIQKFQYDTIYHEHLSYISIKPLVQFFRKFNMEIYEIKEQDFHGGSIRVFVRRKFASKYTINFIYLLKREEVAGIYDLEKLQDFSKDVQQNRRALKDLILGLKKQGKKIVVVSAPAKGMTLLNFCNLDDTVISFATEKAKLKIGKFTPGTLIPVVPDSFLWDAAPDYALLLAWNFADEIIKNNTRFKGRYIIPIPTPRIVN